MESITLVSLIVIFLSLNVISSILLVKIKLCNVIVDCHDCNRNMHLPKFSALNDDLRKNGQHCLFPQNIPHCVYRSSITKKNVSPPPLKQFLRTPLGQSKAKISGILCIVYF